MGLFSSDCQGCGHPLLKIESTSAINEWMNDVVAIRRDGTMVRGFYDGYGGLYDDDENMVAGERAYSEPDADGNIQMIVVSEPVSGWFDGNDGPTVWHHACWRFAGSPAEYRGQSKSSDDQGHFFDDGDHDMAEPKAKTKARKR